MFYLNKIPQQHRPHSPQYSTVLSGQCGEVYRVRGYRCGEGGEVEEVENSPSERPMFHPEGTMGIKHTYQISRR